MNNNQNEIENEHLVLKARTKDGTIFTIETSIKGEWVGKEYKETPFRYEENQIVRS